MTHAPCQETDHGRDRIPDIFVMSLLADILGSDTSRHHQQLQSKSGRRRISLPSSSRMMLSIPAGLLGERFGEKPVMITAFLVGTAGSLSFALPSKLCSSGGLAVCNGVGNGYAANHDKPVPAVAGGERALCVQLGFAQLYSVALHF